MRELSGMVAVISGGLGDIGQAIARELARRGADVAVGDVRPGAHADDLLGELRAEGRRARYDRVDVSDAEAVTDWLARVEKDLGAADVIVPNAAVVTRAPIREVTPAEWGRELGINLNGAFYMAQAGANRLVDLKRPGRIVFLGSWAADAPHPPIPAYCVAKAGLRMLCRCLALDLAPHGITVNEVAPGYVDAGLSRQLFVAQPELRAKAAAQVPVGSLTQVEDVARQVAHLCGPQSAQITGSVLLMDGGLSLVTPGSS